MTRQINLQLSDQQYAKLAAIARADDRTIQYVIRKYIDSLGGEPEAEKQ